MGTIAFIESNTTGTGHLLVQKALGRGGRVLFLTQDPARYPFLCSEMLHPVVLDTQTRDPIVACLSQVDDLEAVFSSSEYFLDIAAQTASALGLFAADPAAVVACRDKAALARHLSAAGVAHPRSFVATCLEEAMTLSETWSLPVVVKPRSGSGSVGVRLCQDWPTYRIQVATLFQQSLNERGLQTQPGLLVQEYIDGEEFSVEILGTGEAHRVLGITRKYLSAPPYFVETGHDFPALLPPSQRDSLVTTALQALAAVGLTRGPVHMELRLRGDRAVVIEINPRLAGGMIPVLIETAYGLDVLELVLDLYLGRQIDLTPRQQEFASIRFLIPDRAGTLQDVQDSSCVRTMPGVVQFQVTKKPGEALTQHGDFRDRIGWIITRGTTPTESRERAASALAALDIRVTAAPEATPSGHTGRLKKTLHPEALAIVRVPPSAQKQLEELHFLTAIDEAHLLMLAAQQLLPAAEVGAILAGVQRLQADGFRTIVDHVAPRGTYLLYEEQLRRELGDQLGGSAHLGRSRNDINATVFRLALRDPFAQVYQALWHLRSTLLCRAALTQELAMPIYSQYQPGLPGTLGYYLLAVEEALSRDQAGLQGFFPDLDTLPLGAGAGGGVGFPIDQRVTAHLLGFSSASRNALDAVASRDLALRLLSALAVTGVTVSRLAKDLQLWTTREFAFLELPEELSGSSSMMPQKKNPYLLEIVQGQAMAPLGALTRAVATMAKVPFANSVEVGTEALKGLTEASQEIQEACTLLSLIVEAAQPDLAQMRKSADEGLVMATCIADLLVKEHGHTFREAHFKVGETISTALEHGEEPQAAMYALVPGGNLAGEPLLRWVDHFVYGGGPGRASTVPALAAASERLNHDGSWLRQRTAAWRQAEARRQQEVHACITKSTTERSL